MAGKEEVTQALGDSSRSVNRWAKNYEEYGHVERSFVAAILRDLHELIYQNPSLFLDEIGKWLTICHDQPVSTTAVYCDLRVPFFVGSSSSNGCWQCAADHPTHFVSATVVVNELELRGPADTVDHRLGGSVEIHIEGVGAIV